MYTKYTASISKVTQFKVVLEFLNEQIQYALKFSFQDAASLISYLDEQADEVNKLKVKLSESI